MQGWLRATAHGMRAMARGGGKGGRLLKEAGRARWMSSKETADVVIVGGGIMGLNIAYQLKRRAENLKVVVLEQAAAVGFGSSGYSTGFQRAFYSFDPTMELALAGTTAYKNWKEYLKDPEAQAYFTETGALWMLGKPKDFNQMMQQRLKKIGVESDVLDEADFRKKFPLMNPEPFPKFDEEGNEVDQNLGPFSVLYEHGCGHLDSSTCLLDVLAAAKRVGADVRFKQRVDTLLTKNGQKGDGAEITGVQLVGGSVIDSPVVVNAAGPWFNKINDTVNVKLSTTALPTRIQVGHKYIPDEYCDLPFTADTWGASGIYFMPRRANNQLVFGSVDHRFESEIVNPDDYNQNLDPDFKQVEVCKNLLVCSQQRRQEYLNAVFHRLPGLPTSGSIVGFSSMYTVNQDDVHPIIGQTKVKGLWACNGFSGHGFKLAPAVGSLVSQQITGIHLKGELGESTIDHDFMGPYRKPLLETDNWDNKTHFA